MYIMPAKLHTMSLMCFYGKSLFKYIALRGGVGYLKTANISSIGFTAGAGLIFPIGKILIVQPMTDINFGSMKNNIMGINLNMGVSF